MAIKIQLRRDTAFNWFTNDPILAEGEPGLEIDTNSLKYGDGSTKWNDLPYSSLIDEEKMTTANVVEIGNLYFSNARAYANTISIGYAPNAYVNSRLLFKANTADLTTANTIEVNNLYFTSARVYANVTSMGFTTNSQLGSVVTAINNELSTKTTIEQVYANVTSIGYATNSYVNNQLINKANTSDLVGYLTVSSSEALFSAKANVVDLTTANVVEETNLYFTNARVYANIITLDYASNIYVNNELTNKANVSDFTFVATELTNKANTSDLVNYVSTASFGSLTNTVNTKITANTDAYLGNLNANAVVTSTTFILPRYSYNDMISLNASNGEIIFETSNNLFMGYNGTSWVQLG